MLEIPFDPQFADNMDRTNSHGSLPCVICGRECRNPRYKVYVDSGFSQILTPDEFKQDAGEMGLFPIGADCLNQHPEIKPYVQPVQTAPARSGRKPRSQSRSSSQRKRR